MTKNKTILSLSIFFTAAAIIIGTTFWTNQTQPATTPPTPTSEQQPGIPAHTSDPIITSTPQPTNVIRLAWFYKPPDPMEMDLVAKETDFFILTYKDENERDNFKAKGVSVPFSQYLLFTVINDPGGCDEKPPGNQVAFKVGDFCQISQEHPDWFLLDVNGNRIQSNEESYYMDPGNEGFRTFWLQRARELQETYGWDNIFLDNVEASRFKIIQDGGAPAKYPDDKSYQQATVDFLIYIRENYFGPKQKPIYGNIISVSDIEVWHQYMQYLDGAMIESFATDWDDGYRDHDEWEIQMDQVEKALKQGKTMILVAQGEKDDKDLQNFTFASYLLLANGNSFFRYTNTDSYREAWQYDNYNIELGKPLGDRYKHKGGWRRDFENGYVTVNPKKHTAEIILNP